MTTEAEFSYDRILYPMYLHSQTHPERLAIMARFFGMQPAAVENCRMLELGCGSGGSLLAFALGLPECQFVGIDLGERQIALGREAQAAAGITNLQLLHADLMEIDRETIGDFDYIVAHGLYSWVPAAVRERVLEICRATLKPHGVAFISYNAYPGWHIREITRGIMSYHTRSVTDPIERTQQAMAVMKFVADGANHNKLYQKIYESELDVVTERKPENIFHDDLSEVNQPFYLHEFAADAERYGLKYFSDVQFFASRDLDYPPDVIELLMSMSGNTVMREQYMDFLNCRRFRQSLLCRAERELEPEPIVEALDEVRLTTKVKPDEAEPDLSVRVNVEFRGPRDHNVVIDHPLTKAALTYLGRLWPRSATLSDLTKNAAGMLESGSVSERDEAILREVLMRIFGSGLIEMRKVEPNYADIAGEFPKASPLARWQAARGETVFNLRYESIVIEDLVGLKLIELADGTRDRRRLADELFAYFRSADLGLSAAELKTLDEDIHSKFDEKLSELASHALFLAS